MADNLSFSNLQVKKKNTFTVYSYIEAEKLRDWKQKFRFDWFGILQYKDINNFFL